MAKTYAVKRGEGRVVKLGENATAAAKAKAAKGLPGNEIISGNDPRIAQQRTANQAGVKTAAEQAFAGVGAGRPLETPTPNSAGGLSYEEASQNLQKGGLSGDQLRAAQSSLSKSYGVPGGTQAPVATPGAAPTPMQNKYQQGLSAATSSGALAPQDAGLARTQAAAYLPQTPNTAGVDTMLSDDPAITAIMQNVATLLNPRDQTTTLMQDYKKLYKQSGLQDINEELIDAETIIDGTEDDIRNEIQTAGGMATDSQVQAMGLARNKSLLKRYNQLTQMKSDATNQLNTMMSLNQADKQMAQERVNTQVNTMFKFAEFRQTTINAARETAQWMAQTMGADGLYNSVSADPVQLARTEKILGLSPGGLQKIGAAAAQEKARKSAIEERQIRATESNAAAGWANVSLARQRLAYEMSGNDGKAQAKVQAQVAKADTVLGKVREANNLIKGGWSGAVSTGAIGALAGRIPGSQAYNLKQAVQTVKANLGFDELQKMRDNSPTGGALGQVAVQELAMLQATVANLDTGQDAATLRNNLTQVEKHYTNWLNTNGYGVASTGEIVPL